MESETFGKDKDRYRKYGKGRSKGDRTPREASFGHGGKKSEVLIKEINRVRDNEEEVTVITKLDSSECGK